MDGADQKEVESLFQRIALFDVKELGDRIGSVFRSVQNDKNINPELAEMIFYILSELSDNVEQHSRAEHFSLLVDRDDEDLVFLVADDGMGIPALFEQFLPNAPKDDWQKVKDALENGISTKGDGRGYGLRTVKEMVLTAGGKLVFISGGLGYKFEDSVESKVRLDKKGTIIFIKLPKSAQIKKEEFYRIIEARI